MGYMISPFSFFLLSTSNVLSLFLIASMFCFAFCPFCQPFLLSSSFSTDIFSINNLDLNQICGFIYFSFLLGFASYILKLFY